MHPSEFFDKCNIRTSIDFGEIFDDDLKEKLKNIHPKNFLKSKLTFPVYKVSLEYFTANNNIRKTSRYMIMDSNDNEEEFMDVWVDIFIEDHNRDNPNHKMLDCWVESVEKICDAVLPIG